MNDYLRRAADTALPKFMPNGSVWRYLHMEISFVNTVQFAAKKMPAEGLRIQ